MERHVLHHKGTFTFEAGGSVESPDIVYYTSECPYTPGRKVVWVCHALTGNADPSDWWSGFVGPGKPIDTDKFFVVCASMIGSAYGEFGPATVNPATGKPWLLDFPKVTVRDIVKADILVRKALGIDKIDLMLGPSIGGFQTVEWLVTEPEVIREAVLLATDFRATPYLTAFNESQRMALLADRTFRQAKDIHGGEEGLKCARSIALISYRSVDGYGATQQDPDPDTMFAERAASYQRYQGEKLVRRFFDAYSYWCLATALDSMNVGRGRGGCEAALGTVKARCTVITITSDQLFTVERGRMMAAAIPDCEYYEISSIYGHDGFFIENDQLTAIIAPVLQRL